MDRYDARKVTPVEASAKLDGVYARATRDGIFTKSGQKMPMPHVEKRLRRYFRKNPDGALEGELWRKKAGIEVIAGEARRGGDATRKLKLHVYPGQEGRPLPFGAVRRVKGYKVKDDAGVQKRLRKALRKGHEGVVVKGVDGSKSKLKPQEDAEWKVERSEVGGRRSAKNVLTLRTAEGRPFKVQAGGGAAGAKAGDQVTVRYSGLTRSGKPKAAVAVRIRNEKDFMNCQDAKNAKFFKEVEGMTDREREQVRKDRRALVKGAILTALGGVAAYGILRKGKNAAAAMPAQAAPTKPPVIRNRVVKGPMMKYPQPLKNRVVKGPMMRYPQPLKDPKVKGPGMKKAAAANNERKGGVKRLLRAAELKRERAWDAMKPPSAKRLAKLNPAVRAEYARLDAAARGKGVQPRPEHAAQLTPLEKRKAEIGGRLMNRRILKGYREQKNFERGTSNMEHRTSNGEKIKNAAVAGGALASGGAAIYGARQWGKTNEAIRRNTAQVSAHANQVMAQLTPKEIARQVGAEVSGRAKRTLKGYFPTFIRAGKKVSKLMKTRVFEEKPLSHEELVMRYGKKIGGRRSEIGDQKEKKKRGWLFETPASRLIDFGNDDQLKRSSDRRYADALKAAAGLEGEIYTKVDPDAKLPIPTTVGLRHAQVVRSAYNKANKVQKYAGRGAGVGRDVVDVVRGKPRRRDQAGREKKREWEKPWFKRGVRNVVIAGGLLAGAKHVSKDPEKWRRRVNEHIIRPANRVAKDAFKEWSEGTSNIERRTSNVEVKSFETPAGHFFSSKFNVGSSMFNVRGPLRKGALGKLMGPSAAQRKVAGQREALVGRLKAAAAKGNEKAAGMVNRASKHAAMKQAGVKAAERRQKEAVRGLKKAAAIGGGGAVLGGTAMKLHADQPEDRKKYQGARFRNALVGAAAGSFLGGALHAGKSGFSGARLGAAAGGLIGAVSNPKRKQVIEELPTASFEVKAEKLKSGNAERKRFETPAGRVLHFDWDAEMAGWDIRDPRGKSARVFAPGARKRYRRPKEWHEKKENRDKIAAAAVIAAGLGGVALGTKLGKKLALRKKAPSGGGYHFTPSGPRSAGAREAFQHKPTDRARWN